MKRKLNLEYERAIDKNLCILEEYEVFSEEFELYSLNSEELLEVKKAVDFFLDRKRKFQLEDEEKEKLQEISLDFEIDVFKF